MDAELLRLVCAERSLEQSPRFERQRFADHYRLTAETARLNTFRWTVGPDGTDVHVRYWNNCSCGQFQFIRTHDPKIVVAFVIWLFAALIGKIAEVVASAGETWLNYRKPIHRIVNGRGIAAAQV